MRFCYVSHEQTECAGIHCSKFKLIGLNEGTDQNLNFFSQLDNGRLEGFFAHMPKSHVVDFFFVLTIAGNAQTTKPMQKDKKFIFCKFPAIHLTHKPAHSFWYLSNCRPTKVQTSLRKCAVSPKPSLLAYTKYVCR